jgi:hypothetical protein
MLKIPALLFDCEPNRKAAGATHDGSHRKGVIIEQ